MKRSYALVLLMAGTCEFAGAQILPAPTLLSPSNNAINQPTSPILRWTTVLGTTTYNLQVSLDSLFTTAVKRESSETWRLYVVVPSTVVHLRIGEVGWLIALLEGDRSVGAGRICAPANSQVPAINRTRA